MHAFTYTEMLFEVYFSLSDRPFSTAFVYCLSAEEGAKKRKEMLDEAGDGLCYLDKYGKVGILMKSPRQINDFFHLLYDINKL